MKIVSNSEAVNIFELANENRDSEKVKEALDAVLKVMGELDLTVGESQKFLDLVAYAINEKRIKF
ncbi:hypothetical protein [Thermoanaerobacterium sp. PSU-2]|uniref:hypothetical protein n=1 Tax=Thermoanaerobacterium sp. PSU-2 TaxID=1930849 RepID=UPI00117D99DF|nr:hypothetical protein [Thermoanaerobacterium sp. PSU-2]